MARKITFAEVKKTFSDAGCVLLAKSYTHSKIKMPYICKCGNEAEMNFNNFKSGKRCMKCSGNEKLTFAEVEKTFSDAGCVLLAKSYINSGTKMPYICSCGNKAEIRLNSFKSGKRCMKCSGNERLTFAEVKKFFEDANCVLLAKSYANNRTKMSYICSCGNESEIIFNAFKRGMRCMKCSGTERFTYEYVKNFFEDNNCVLLATEYVNDSVKMPYICSCGNRSEIRLNCFKNGKRCHECGIKKIAERLKLTYEYVKMFFELQGCVLLATEYINSDKKMPYICSCGNEAEINFDNFRNGGRCQKCAGNRILETKKQNKEIWNNTEIDFDFLDRILEERIKQLET